VSSLATANRAPVRLASRALSTSSSVTVLSSSSTGAAGAGAAAPSAAGAAPSPSTSPCSALRASSVAEPQLRPPAPPLATSLPRPVPLTERSNSRPRAGAVAPPLPPRDLGASPPCGVVRLGLSIVVSSTLAGLVLAAVLADGASTSFLAAGARGGGDKGARVQTRQAGTRRGRHSAYTLQQGGRLQFAFRSRLRAAALHNRAPPPAAMLTVLRRLLGHLLILVHIQGRKVLHGRGWRGEAAGARCEVRGLPAGRGSAAARTRAPTARAGAAALASLARGCPSRKPRRRAAAPPRRAAGVPRRRVERYGQPPRGPAICGAGVARTFDILLQVRVTLQ
jgi:hypothetical protein